MHPTIEWKDAGVVMIDQRKLPSAEVYVTCKTASEVARAIKTMVIRGAPAIGVAAAMGIALGMRKSKATGTKQFATEFQKTCDLLAATRPTAVNLFWAIDRMKRAFAAAALAGCSVDEIRQRLDAEATAIHDEDVASCRSMGAHGATLVPQTANILTHCNAGALATAGYGTALGVIRAAVEQGKKIAVLADETRPFLQGARLTAWELVKDGIDTTVITDNMSASMMRLGHVDLVVVGADRIAANGDVANKVGTYGVAVLAKEHGIPFYVAAPISTVDLDTPDGEHIPIEERSEKEVTHVGTSRITPGGARIRNPAFDVTPAKYVTAIVTERGIATAPYNESLARLAGSAANRSPEDPASTARTLAVRPAGRAGSAPFDDAQGVPSPRRGT
jgi:methylthioribose-1-phosphate isomerase